MNLKSRLIGLAAIAILIGTAGSAWAFPQFAMSTKASCNTCHSNPAGGAALNDAGKAYKADNTKAPTAAADGAAYVGTKCKMCHSKEYKAWQDTPHSKSLLALKTSTPEKIAEMAKRLGVELKGPADKDDRCLACHVTGFHLDGGFPAADSTKSAALSSVACEMCHGPGSKHVAAAKADKKANINGAVGEAMCRSCHTKEMSPDFDFAKFKAKGVHAVPAE
jgi:hypothetical protein